MASRELAVQRWTSGRPTLSQLPTLLIHVLTMASWLVKAKPVETLTDTMAHATRMAATPMLTGLTITNSMEEAQISLLTLQDPSLL